jgi:hypothetical protein
MGFHQEMQELFVMDRLDGNRSLVNNYPQRGPHGYGQAIFLSSYAAETGFCNFKDEGFVIFEKKNI